MRINYNATAMVAANALTRNEKSLSASTQKLSSGYKINRAQDNPSGYALSRRMRAQITALSQSSDNASDGVNIIETADGALSEIQEMLQRMNELSVQAANGTLSSSDRKSIDVEVQEMKKEIQRVSDETEFNGQALLNGTFDLRGYTDNVNVKVQSYAEGMMSGSYSLQITGLTAASFDSNGYITADLATLGVTQPVTTVDHALPADVKVSSINDNTVTLTGSDGFSMTLALSADYATAANQNVTVDLTGIGAMTLQVGANEGQTIDVNIRNVSVSSLGLTSMNVLTQDSSDAGISKVGEAIRIVSEVRSRLGAFQNRLESTGASNDTAVENMTSAMSSITDVDMAEEYSRYSTYQILEQASTSVLAQANKQPSDVLQLLQ